MSNQDSIRAECRNLIADGERENVVLEWSLEYVDPCHPRVMRVSPAAAKAIVHSEMRQERVRAVLQQVCALLNLGGGSLVLGVHKDGHVSGIEPDVDILYPTKSCEAFQERLEDLVRSRLDPQPALIKFSFVVLNGKTICRVDLHPTNSTTYRLDGQEFLRRGQSTREV